MYSKRYVASKLLSALIVRWTHLLKIRNQNIESVQMIFL